MNKNNDIIWLGLGALITGGIGYGLYPYLADLVKDNIEFTQWLDIKEMFPILYGCIFGAVILFYFVKPLLEKL